MSRRSFVYIASSFSALVTVVLMLAAVGAFAAHRFVDSQVTAQLSEQNIYFPEVGSEALERPGAGQRLAVYAGQQLTTGQQAKVFADDLIGEDLKEIGGGKTYAEVSKASRANPQDTKLAGQAQTLFRGEALRGMLLTAYGFWQMGEIARLGSHVALGLAAVMAFVTAAGFRRAGGIGEEEVIFEPAERRFEPRVATA
jgi:hypothetical protein